MSNNSYTKSVKNWIADASTVAYNKRFHSIMPVHMLDTIGLVDDAIEILKRFDEPVDIAKLKQITSIAVGRAITKDTIGDWRKAASDELTEILNQAQAQAKARAEKDNDESSVVSVADILLVMASSEYTKDILAEVGIAPKALETAVGRKAEDAVKQKQEALEELAEAGIGGDASSKEVLLSTFGRDLTMMAEQGMLDPVIGRGEETRAVYQTLLQHMRSTPVLIGHRGVGKTSIVKSLAQRIHSGDVPKSLTHKRLIQVSLPAFRAASDNIKDFERKFASLLQEVKRSSGEVILFLEGIQAINSKSQATSILKSFLDDGGIYVIGETTTDGYKEHLAKTDVVSHFQQIEVEETDEKATMEILRGVASDLQRFHQVSITDEALSAAISMSIRYLTNEFLPSKAILVVDKAATRMRAQLDSQPVEIDDLQRKLNSLSLEEAALTSATDKTPRTQVVLHEIRSERADVEDQLTNLRAKWKAEQENRETSMTLRSQIDEIMAEVQDLTNKEEFAEAASKRAQAEEIQKQLDEKVKSEDQSRRIIADFVGRPEIALVIQDETGIPVGSILEDEAEKLLNLESIIAKKFVGQEEAVRAICNSIRESRSGVGNPKQPTGSFFLLGPSGTGKTQLAKRLAATLFNSEDAMVRIDMSEYSESNNVARLIGAPPGYVGYEAGGQLTEKILKSPYSVVLLDEVEKAHPKIFDILLQVLDDGRLTDGQGRTVDFSNTIIILTSNVAAHALIDENLTDEMKDQIVDEQLLSTFRPEFLNRFKSKIKFKPFTVDQMKDLVPLAISEIEQRLAEKRIRFKILDSAVNWLATEGHDPRYGARPLLRLIAQHLNDRLSPMILSKELDDDDVVTISYKDGDDTLTLDVEKREFQAPVDEKVLGADEILEGIGSPDDDKKDTDDSDKDRKGDDK